MSYKLRIFISFIIIISLVEISIVVYQVKKSNFETEVLVHQRSNDTVDMFAKVLAVPTWQMDRGTIMNILQSLLDEPDIVQVHFKEMDSAIQPISLKTNQLAIKPFEVSLPIYKLGSDRVIAHLSITFSRQSSQAIIDHRNQSALIEIFILLLINLLLAYFTLKWISQPLQKFVKVINQLAHQQFDVNIPDTNRHDEIGEVARAVEVLKQNSIDLLQLKQKMQDIIDEQIKELTFAKDKAEAANVAKSQFLAVMTHEIRTPLNGMLGMAQLMDEEPLSGEQKEKIAMLIKSSEDLMAIVNDVLDFSKLDAGQMELSYRKLNPKQLGQSCYDLFAPSVDQDKITFEYNYAENIPDTFQLDEMRIRQILINLLSNAVKFTHNGYIQFSVDYTPDEMLIFQIKDSGIGISAAQVEQLFDPFKQADQETTRKYGGTGLGLSICRNLANLMQGDIKVQSKLNLGSSFQLELPATAVENNLPSRDDVQNKVAEEQIKSDNPLLKSPLLVVEDNPVNQKIAMMMLKKLGFESDMAVDGFEAIEAVKRKHYALIFMDCLMPNMDGYQATREIRKYQQASNQSIILALTANNSAEDIQRCKQCGMDGVITKPYKKSDLVQTLNQWGDALNND